jgi:ankyrin repeat protein
MKSLLLAAIVAVVALLLSQNNAVKQAMSGMMRGGGGERALMVELFYNASLSNRSDVLQQFFDNGTIIDADERTSFGNTALSGAALFGRRANVELLMARGADVNALQGDGATPLLSATFSGDEALALRLITKYGARVDVANKNGASPLHGAALLGRHQLLDALLERGAPVNARDESHITPLHGAVMGGHASAVARLLAAGARRDLLTRDRQSLLHWLCAGTGSLDVLTLLYAGKAQAAAAAADAHDADADVATGAGADAMPEVDARDTDGRTALHMCVLRGYNDTVQALLERGANALLRDNEGHTPLALAFERLDTDTARPLMELPVERSGVLLANRRNETLLHWAAGQGYAALVKRLLGMGVALEARDVEGRSALHHAALGGHTAALQALVEAGGDVAARDHAGLGLMQLGALAGSRYAMLLPASIGVPFSDAPGADRLSPLHLVCAKASQGVVTELLTYGAPLHALDARRRTPLHHCVSHANFIAVRELLEVLRRAIDLLVPIAAHHCCFVWRRLEPTLTRLIATVQRRKTLSSNGSWSR